MSKTIESQHEGQPVFVRTVSGVIVFVAVTYTIFQYCFHIAIARAYAADSSVAAEFSWVGLALVIAAYFALAVWRGKFVWFLNGRE